MPAAPIMYLGFKMIENIVAAFANILVMLSDSFLRPILLVRGAPVPMLVIYWGRHFIPRV
jgi:hypothetical protein